MQNLLYDISQIAIPFDRMDASEPACNAPLHLVLLHHCRVVPGAPPQLLLLRVDGISAGTWSDKPHCLPAPS